MIHTSKHFNIFFQKKWGTTFAVHPSRIVVRTGLEPTRTLFILHSGYCISPAMALPFRHLTDYFCAAMRYCAQRYGTFLYSANFFAFFLIKKEEFEGGG